MFVAAAAQATPERIQSSRATAEGQKHLVRSHSVCCDEAMVAVHRHLLCRVSEAAAELLHEPSR